MKYDFAIIVTLFATSNKLYCGLNIIMNFETIQMIEIEINESVDRKMIGRFMVCIK
jgi:hypothetical protein